MTLGISMRTIKKILAVAVLFAAIWGYQRWHESDAIPTPPESEAASTPGRSPRAETGPAEAPRAGSQFESEGTVVRILSDDNEGSRHQRFILRLASGRTVLIVHNIDLAPRVEDLATGDTIAFSGEFEDNEKGGVVHWTHHDPNGGHTAGWIRHHGRTYQ
jgi:uncharacterized protein DUF3465